MDQLDRIVEAWATALGWPLEGFFRLVLAAVAGGLVGLEREVRGRQAGFRTNLLVCLGSALVMLVSIHFGAASWAAPAGVIVQVDPARIAYGVMTGIGFLGAGAIIQSRGTVRGLTTAAGLWCVAAIGLASGFGMYVIVILATLLVLLALWLLDYVEDILPRTRYRTVTVRCRWDAECMPKIIQRFKVAGLHVVDASFERIGDLSEADIYLEIAFVRKQQYFALERELAQDEECRIIATREK